MKLINIWLLLVLIGQPSNVLLANQQNASELNITGHINDNSVDTIVLQYYPCYFTHVKDVNAIYDTCIVKDGIFRFSQKHVPQSYYIDIYFIKKGRDYCILNSREKFHGSLGDSLILHVTGAIGPKPNYKIRFEGRGSAKYNYLLRKNELIAKSLPPIRDTTSNATLDQLEIDINEFDEQKESFLESQKPNLTPKEYRQLKIDLLMERINSDMRKYSLIIANTIDSQYSPRKYYITQFQRKYINFPVVNFSDEDKTGSQVYAQTFIEWLYRKQQLEAGKFKELKKVDGEDMCEFITNNFSGPLREKLLITFYLRCGFMTKMSSYYLKTQKHFTDGYLREISERLGKFYSQNVPVYHFDFADSTQRHISNDILKGKITLFDFWYTGCAGCAKVKKDLEPKLDKWTKNKKFQVISVSVDKDQSKWKKSLINGLYSHPKAINLLAKPRKDDGFFNFYNIKSYPRLMLADSNGNVISSQVSPKDVPNIVDSLLK